MFKKLAQGLVSHHLENQTALKNVRKLQQIAWDLNHDVLYNAMTNEYRIVNRGKSDYCVFKSQKVEAIHRRLEEMYMFWFDNKRFLPGNDYYDDLVTEQ